MGWAYFLDVDGTLLELAPTPAGVVVDEDLAALIGLLHAHTGGAVALISGRSIRDIDSILPVPPMPVAGQHGLERRTAAGKLIRPRLESIELHGVRERLAEVVSRHPGLLLEDKGHSIALHYRAVPALAAYAHRVMRMLVDTLGSEFVVQRGKRVVELKPAGRDKGGAIRDFMEEAPFAGRVPVFLGDDATDEFGFAVVNGIGGHSIKVGRGASGARWRLQSVRGVRAWLVSGIPSARLARSFPARSGR